MKIRDAKKLYKICYENKLTMFEFTASKILLEINGMENALGYLEKNINYKKNYVIS